MSNKKVERLKSLIECSICLEQYVEPKMLDCTHEFCKLCIEQLMQFQEDGSAEVICPMRCVNKTLLPKDQTVHDLPASLNFKNIIEVLMEDEQEKENKKGAFCSYTKKCKNKPVTVYCCGKLMCNACFGKHSTSNRNNNNNSDNSCNSNRTKKAKSSSDIDKNKKIPPTKIDSAHQPVSVSYDKSDSKLKIVCNDHHTFCRSVCEDKKLLCAYCENRDNIHKHHSKKVLEKEIELWQQHVQCEASYRKRLNKLKEITQEYMNQSEEKFRDALKRRKEECMKRYAELLDQEESDLLKEYKERCESYIEDEFGNLLPTKYCDDILRKEDVELFLQNEGIFDQVSQSATYDIETLEIFYDDSLSYLCPNPMGKFTISCAYLCLEEVKLQPTFKFAFATEGKVDDGPAAGNELSDLRLEDYSIRTNLNVSLALKLRGNDLFQKGSLEKAKIVYSKAIVFCPTDATELAIFYQNRAAVYEKLGDSHECINDCTDALKIDPCYVKALQRRSRMHEEDNDMDKAFKDAVTAKYVDVPANRKSYDLVKFYNDYGKELLEDYIAPNYDKLSIAPHLIRLYFSDFGGLDIFDISGTSSSEDMLYCSIVHDLRSEAYDTIESRCSEVIQLNGKRKYLALLLRGSIRYCKNDMRNAMLDFDSMISHLDDNKDKILKVHALVRRARLRKTFSNVNGYREDLAEAKRIDDSNPIISHIEAEFEVDDDEIENTYRLAISLDASFIAPLLGLGEYLMLKGKAWDDKTCFREANDLFKQAVTIDPKNSHSLCKYGQFLLRIGKVNEALSRIEQAISIAPSHPQPYVAKAEVLLERGNIVEANQLCEKAIAMDFYCYEAHLMSGKIALANGPYIHALASFNDSIPMSPHTRNVLVQTLSLRKECEIMLKLHIEYAER